MLKYRDFSRIFRILSFKTTNTARSSATVVSFKSGVGFGFEAGLGAGVGAAVVVEVESGRRADFSLFCPLN